MLLLNQYKERVTEYGVKKMNELTEFGIAAVKYDFDKAEKELIKAKERLLVAEQHVTFMKQVSSCDHDLYNGNGYTYVITTCRKCGYSWYD